MQTTTNDTNTSEYSPVTTQPNETAEQSDTPLTAELVKPRSEWDEDERLDGRQKFDSIQVLVVPTGAAPYTQIIGNNLDAMQGVVQGLITTFDTGIEGVIGVANDEALMDGLPLNRQITATGSGIFGTFFLAGDGINFHSLSDEEIARCRAVFAEQIVSANPKNEAVAVDTSIEVLVFRPEEIPFVTTITANPETSYLPALQHLIAEPHPIHEVKPFGVATFEVPVPGTIGLCHKGNTDGTVLSIDAHHFAPNRRVIYMPSMFYGTFIVAADIGLHDLHSITPQLLEKLLDAFAPELEASEFEQVMHGLSTGAEYMANWD